MLHFIFAALHLVGKVIRLQKEQVKKNAKLKDLFTSDYMGIYNID
jgi:hypothetical protein